MNTQTTPQFLVYAKRKSSKEPFANLYVRITHEKKIHEKSLNIRCPFENWQSDRMIIKDYPLETAQLNKSFDELKQKIMGAYYMLQQQVSDFGLQDLVDLAWGERTPGVLSFTQCFQDIIERMEKSKGDSGSSIANIQKHKRCLDHFRLFVRKYYKTSNLSFARINRTTVDELAEFLKEKGNCSHNTSLYGRAKSNNSK